MKILHVLDHSIPLHSGYTFRTRNILEQQRALGWETCHLTGLKQGLSPSLREQVDGLGFYRTPGAASLADRLPVLNQLRVIDTLQRRLEEIVELEKPDILHAHSPALNGVAAVRVGRKRGIPVVYECRAFWEDAAVDHGSSREFGLRYRLTRAMETWVFRRADHVTTICQGLRNEIVARGIPESRVEVIPNAVDPEKFSRRPGAGGELARELGLEGKQVLGFIGSFYAYEGIPLLLEVMPSIVAAHPRTRLLLVGGGPEQARIEAAIEANGLAQKVVYTGRVAHERVTEYYDLVDIFVYPRLPMRLTELVTPLKPLEAMAQEKMVVASDVGGHRELIRDGETGRLFAAGDSADLERVLAKLLAEEDLSAYHRAGLAFVRGERTWRNSVGRYAGIYEGLTRVGATQSGEPAARESAGEELST